MTTTLNTNIVSSMLLFPGLDIESWTLGNLPTLEFPSIELGLFPGMEVIRFPASLPSNLQLPSFNIQEFPNVKLPTFKVPKLPDTSLVAGLTIRAPKINIKLNIGGSLMKIKLFLGFTQCVSFFPVRRCSSCLLFVNVVPF